MIPITIAYYSGMIIGVAIGMAIGGMALVALLWVDTFSRRTLQWLKMRMGVPEE
jgi:hypothetical protein